MSPRKPRPAHRPKTIVPKSDLLLHIAPEKMLLLKGMLFQYNLTAHQFMEYLISNWDVRDERLVSLLEGTIDYKKQRILEGKEEHIAADDIYRMISEINDEKRNLK